MYYIYALIYFKVLYRLSGFFGREYINSKQQTQTQQKGELAG